MPKLTADDVLAHFGVKGMKWGVRKARGDRDAVFRKRAKEQQEVKVTTTPGRKVRAEGGKYTPPSADAITAAKSKQLARKSTTDSLSTKELQAVVQRIQLEQQYSKLVGDQQPLSMKLGKAAVKMILNQTDDDQVDAFSDFVGGKVSNPKAAKVATAGTKMASNAAREKAKSGGNQQKSKKKK